MKGPGVIQALVLWSKGSLQGAYYMCGFSE